MIDVCHHQAEIFLLLFSVIGAFEPWASYFLDRFPTTELHPQPRSPLFFVSVFFKIEFQSAYHAGTLNSLNNSGWPWTHYPCACFFKGAKAIGVYYHTNFFITNKNGFRWKRQAVQRQIKHRYTNLEHLLNIWQFFHFDFVFLFGSSGQEFSCSH